MHYFPVAVLAFVVIGVVLFTPRSCQIEGKQLKVRTILFTFTYDLSRAIDVRPIASEEINGWTTRRLFGIGWPLQRTGWFYNRQLGTFLNLANDPATMCLVQFPGKKLVVSPAGGMQQITQAIS